MRTSACLAAAALALLSCSQFGAGSSPSPSPVATSPSPSPESLPTPSPSPSPSPSPVPSPTPPTTLDVQILQSDYGAIGARTEPGASCYAQAVLPNGSNAGGIHNPQTADASGNVNWIYPQPATQTGKGLSTVSCTNGRLSGSAQAYFQVGA